MSESTKKRKASESLPNANRKPPRTRYVNKQRTLVFSGRNISDRSRHLMNDFRDLLPHSKKEPKLDKKRELKVINEVADMKNCNNCIFFEPRKNSLYMWMSRIPSGPSMRFLVQNIHTMAELKLTGNVIKGARPMLVFDENFDKEPHLKVLKELMSQVLGTPRGHPKSMPFIDHVFSFFYLDGRIWFRNYQLVYDAQANPNVKAKPVLVECGPRFVLQPVRFLSGSFGGRTLWQDEEFIPPHVLKTGGKKRKADRYVNTQRQKRARNARMEEFPEVGDKFELANVFKEGEDYSEEGESE